MKRLGLTLVAFCGLWLVSGNLPQLLAEKKDKECCGNNAQENARSGEGPWVCPLFVLYDYGNGEYLYYGERREADCYDEPHAAGLFGSWELPRNCELSECIHGYLLTNDKTKTYLTMEKKKPGVKPKYIHSRPARERTFAYEDPRLQFITFSGTPFGHDRTIVAKVNLVEVIVNDERLPRGRQVLTYSAWETDGSDLTGIESLPVSTFRSVVVTNNDGSVKGHVLVATLLHPLSRKPVDIYLLLGDRSE